MDRWIGVSWVCNSMQHTHTYHFILSHWSILKLFDMVFSGTTIISSGRYNAFLSSSKLLSKSICHCALMGEVLWSHHWVLNVTKWSIMSGQPLGNVMMSSISVSASQFHYSLSSLWTWAVNMRAPGRNSTRADKNKRATNNRTQNSKFIYNVINLSLFSDWTNKQNYASLALILINKNLNYVFQPSSKSYL